MNAFIRNGASELVRLSVIQGKGDRRIGVKQPWLLQIPLPVMNRVLSWNYTVLIWIHLVTAETIARYREEVAIVLIADLPWHI